MRILHYNILDGCAGKPARLAGVLAWIARQNADVVGLCELNGWDNPPVMAAHAAACGFAHSYLLVGTSPYRIGLMAREPITVLQQIVTGVHHGILHARIGGRSGDVEYIYTHFSPHERLMRIHEAQVCASLAASIAGPLVLMGDLNSHSPLDQAMCESFRTEANEDWAMDFEPQQILLDAGLIDTAERRKGVRYLLPERPFGCFAQKVPDPFSSPDADCRWTLPTPLIPPGCKRRVDYIYVNAAFQQRYPATRSRIIHGAEVANLSDHYPVLCDTTSH